MSEEWRVIPGFPCYSASSLGRIMRNCDGVHSKKGKLIKVNFNGRYGKIPIFNQTGKHNISAHTAICSAFYGPRPSKDHQVRHLDGDPKNNRAVNLCWGTAKENAMDRERHGRTFRGKRKDISRFARGEDNKGGNKLKNEDVMKIFLDTRSNPKIAADYGVSITIVRYIKIRRNWRHVTDKMEKPND